MLVYLLPKETQKIIEKLQNEFLETKRFRQEISLYKSQIKCAKRHQRYARKLVLRCKVLHLAIDIVPKRKPFRKLLFSLSDIGILYGNTVRRLCALAIVDLEA